MKSATWRTATIITLVGMIGIVLVATLRGGCADVIETTMGSGVPMKCHWCFRAVTVVGCMGTVSSILALFAKDAEGRRTCAVMTILACIAIIALPSPVVVGICQGSGAHFCHLTALLTWCLSAMALIASLVQIAHCDPDKHHLRKRL